MRRIGLGINSNVPRSLLSGNLKSHLGAIFTLGNSSARYYRIEKPVNFRYYVAYIDVGDFPRQKQANTESCPRLRGAEKGVVKCKRITLGLL